MTSQVGLALSARGPGASRRRRSRDEARARACVTSSAVARSLCGLWPPSAARDRRARAAPAAAPRAARRARLARCADRARRGSRASARAARRAGRRTDRRPAPSVVARSAATRRRWSGCRSRQPLAVLARQHAGHALAEAVGIAHHRFEELARRRLARGRNASLRRSAPLSAPGRREPHQQRDHRAVAVSPERPAARGRARRSRANVSAAAR